MSRSERRTVGLRTALMASLPSPGSWLAAVPNTGRVVRPGPRLVEWPAWHIENRPYAAIVTRVLPSGCHVWLGSSQKGASKYGLPARIAILYSDACSA